MANPRTPIAKAEVSGATQKHPERFRDRKSPKRTRPIGDPYAAMPDDQKDAWREYVAELPWLTSSHRQLLRLACMLTVRMDDPLMGVSAAKTLSSVLSKLGATPVDESKVNHGDEEDEDPADRFFGRSH